MKANKQQDKNKPLTEQQSRQQLIEWARRYGAESDLLRLFQRFDDLLKGAKSAEEYNAIGALGCIEVDKFFSGKQNSELVIDNKISKLGEKK